MKVGDLAWESIYSPVRDASGAVTSVIGVAGNVTERVRAEEALKTSEERYRVLVESANDGIFAVGIDNRFISVNGAIESMLGYSRAELCGMDVTEVIAPEYLESADAMTAQKVSGGGETTYEIEVICKDGTRLPLEISSWLAFADGEPTVIHGIARDVSERQAVAATLQRRDAVLEAVGFAGGRFLSGSDYTAGMDDVLDRLGQATGVCRVYVFENHQGADGELLTSQRFEWTGEGVLAQIDNAELQELPYRKAGFARWEAMLGAGSPVFGDISDFPPSEQEILDAQDIVSLAVVPIFVGGAWWGFMGFDECSEQRKWSPAEIEALRVAGQLIGAAMERQRGEEVLREVDEALRESEEKYRDLVENSNEIIYTLDASGTITYISPAIRQLGGYEPEEVIGKTSLSFVHPEDLPDLAASFQRTIGGSPEPSEYRLSAKSGEYVWVQTSSKPIYDGDEIVGLRGLIVDIDQRKRAEEALSESEDRYRELFENASDLVYAHDLEGRYISVNRAVEQITGYRRRRCCSNERFLLKTSGSGSKR